MHCISSNHITISIAGADLAVGDAVEDVSKDDENEYDDDMHMHMEPCEPEVFSGDELEPELHSGFLFVKDSDSEDEDDATDMKVEIEEKKQKVAAVESRPEYQQIKAENLHIRPVNSHLCIHPAAMVWRSYGGTTHFGRSFGSSSGRNERQALLRVIELMWQSYIDLHPKDKLAKKQLEKVSAARAAEPKHKD